MASALSKRMHTADSKTAVRTAALRKKAWPAGVVTPEALDAPCQHAADQPPSVALAVSAAGLSGLALRLGKPSPQEPASKCRLLPETCRSCRATGLRSDFDAAVDRAQRLSVEIVEGPLVNPAPQHRELWIRDIDGYVIVLASPDGERV